MSAATLLCALAALAASAPIPPPKARTRPDVCGAWDMTWDNNGWSATFAEGGFYRSTGHGWSYEGRWELKGDVLTITEHNATLYAGAEPHWATYRWRLLPGKLESKCGAFRLRRAK
jgi:hypothetical protein